MFAWLILKWKVKGGQPFAGYKVQSEPGKQQQFSREHENMEDKLGQME